MSPAHCVEIKHIKIAEHLVSVCPAAEHHKDMSPQHSCVIFSRYWDIVLTRYTSPLHFQPATTRPRYTFRLIVPVVPTDGRSPRLHTAVPFKTSRHVSSQTACV